jgi:hypothetical protein
MTKALPHVKFTPLGVRDDTRVRSLLRPLPELLTKAAGAEGKRHAKVADRFGKVTAQVLALRRKLEAATASDEQAAKDAIIEGRETPAPSSEAIEAELKVAEEELRLVTEAVGPSAQRLLDVAAGHAEEVAAEADERAEEYEQQVLVLLGEVRELLLSASELRDQSAFASLLATEGAVVPYMHRPQLVLTAVIDETIRQISEERERRLRRLAELEHERIAANAVPTPDGGYRVLPPPPSREERLEAERAAAAETTA